MIKLILLILFFFSSLFAQNGIIKSYYGPKKIRARISYVKGILDGPSIWYYENGNLRSEKTYDKGRLNGYVREYFESGFMDEEYFVRQGIRDGINRIYWENGALKEIRTYELGILSKRVPIDYDPLFVANIEDYRGIPKREQTTVTKEEIICDVEICPSPIGGMKSIQDRILYPNEAKLFGLEGTVSLIAAINSEGFVTRTEVIISLGLGCDEEAKRVVSETRFLPGQNQLGVVASNLTLYVKFELSAETLLTTNQLPERLDRNSEVAADRFTASVQYDDSLDSYFAGNTILDKDQNPQVNNTQKILANPILNVTEENSKSVENVEPGQTNRETPTEIVKPIIVYKNFECDIEECPEPVGGMVSIMNNFTTPRKVNELKLNGDVVISADIDKYGNVRNTTVISGLGFGCDEAAEVAILDTKFKSGKQRNERVRANVIIVIPVRSNQ